MGGEYTNGCPSKYKSFLFFSNHRDVSLVKGDKARERTLLLNSLSATVRKTVFPDIADPTTAIEEKGSFNAVFGMIFPQSGQQTLETLPQEGHSILFLKKPVFQKFVHHLGKNRSVSFCCTC